MVDKYKPVGALTLNRVYCKIDKCLDLLGIEHDESVAQILINAICRNGIEICIKQIDERKDD